MTTDLHFCLGADCPGLEQVPTLSNPHPSSCQLSGTEIACCIEDVRERHTVAAHMLLANQAMRDGDEDAAYQHFAAAVAEEDRQANIRRITRDLEAQMPEEEKP